MLEEQMNKLYNKVNKEYKTITRKMANAIVHRIDEITDLYMDYCFPNLNDKAKRKNENALLLLISVSHKHQCYYNNIHIH
ncbi:hypothetical protein TRFO_42914 [Tritrichomonas foetus]|uniref:Uncharacterized protein n=1 Tax=Tritrichomonas foetus TaxID=1144522 RepID=A0A1J4KTS2_9EUKA|nr:hypothetical protein TRFO_42914 [Tritrichomonas foetus]|eukprot:OHT14659.1 hypothetical protein TRFO_42914 [Tritrichomonas foetus]